MDFGVPSNNLLKLYTAYEKFFGFNKFLSRLFIVKLLSQKIFYLTQTTREVAHLDAKIRKILFL